MITKSISAANKLISELFITEPNEHPLEQVVRYCGAHYDEKPMNGADGRIIFRGDEAIVIINNLISNNNKKRFVVAHELGHLRLHRNSSKFFNCTEQNFIEWQSGSQEAEANEFAAEFLMPSEIFKREVEKSEENFLKDRIISLSNIFCTSFTSTAIRFTNFGNVEASIFLARTIKLNGILEVNCFVLKKLK